MVRRGVGWNDVHQPKVPPVRSGRTLSRASGRLVLGGWDGECVTASALPPGPGSC